jgi:hypothetical protein
MQTSIDGNPTIPRNRRAIGKSTPLTLVADEQVEEDQDDDDDRQRGNHGQRQEDPAEQRKA